MSQYSKGDRVKWQWGEGSAEGNVDTIYTQKITKSIKGTEVVREASEEEPAYLVIQDDDDQVLKSHSELQKI